MKGSEMEMHSEVEACRTCGIFFLTSSNLLRYLFGNEPEITLVRKELESWKLQLSENDVFPKYICTLCLLEFHRIFKFQTTVIQTQQQLQQLYNFQQENMQKIKIKTENQEEQREDIQKCILPEEPNVCAFVYVDDLSDNEYDENEEKNIITPFKVPHIPIKDEIIEEAFIPKADESLAPEMSVLALTQVNKSQSETQPKQEVDVGVHCNLCLHISEDQQQHRQHLLRIHETKPVECHICGKQFPPGTTETRLKYHMKWHRISKHIKCSQCGFHCPSRDVLNEHMRAVHTKIPCTICGKLLLPKKMRTHLQKHENTETSQRLADTTHFTDDKDFDQQSLLLHNMTNDQLMMSSFQTNSNPVTQNILLQTDFTPSTSCETTSTTIASNSPNEQSQFLNYTEGENTFENSDEIGVESFPEDISKISGQIDMEDSTNYFGDELEEEEEADDETFEEMQFTCAQCPESFTRVELLIAHAETHNEKAKPFECNVCGKVFELKFSLNRHLKKHKNTTL